MKNFILKLIIVAFCSLAILFSFIGCLEDDESGFIVDNPIYLFLNQERFF